MPREPFCFSHHSGGFPSLYGRFLYRNRLFLYFHRFPGTLSLCQAGIYLSRLISARFFFSPDTFQPRNGPAVYHPAATARIRTGHDSGTVSPFVHSTLSPLVPVYPSPVHGTPAAASLPHGWQRNPKPHHLKNFSGMCCFSLATSSRCVSVSVAVSPVLWSVTEAQACPSVVMSQSGSRYWWLLQITTGSVPYSALRLSSSTCTHASIFRQFQHRASPL